MIIICEGLSKPSNGRIVRKIICFPHNNIIYSYHRCMRLRVYLLANTIHLARHFVCNIVISDKNISPFGIRWKIFSVSVQIFVRGTHRTGNWQDTNLANISANLQDLFSRLQAHQRKENGGC